MAKRTADSDKLGADGTTAKKSNGMGEPTKVVHFRSLPTNTGEAELRAHLAPHVQPTTVIMLSDGMQALVEVPTMQDSRRLVEDIGQFNIGGRTVYTQYSRHTKLEETKPTRDQPQGARVLMASVRNVIHPIDLDTFHTLFSRCGEVRKIVTFDSRGKLQALVEMATPDQARAAVQALDQQEIYEGCCFLSVTFSRQDSVTVKNNSARARDYTIPLASAGGQGLMQPTAQMYGGMMPRQQMQAPPQQQMGMYGSPAARQGMPMGQQQMGFGAGGYNMMGGAAAGMPGVGLGQAGRVVLISNCNPEQITCDHLFMLCGAYGDVERVKLTRNDHSKALVQLQTPQQASAVIQNLSGVTFQGSELHIGPSKHPEVSMPKNDDGMAAEEHENTKDYSNSPIHRFKKPGSYKHIYAPTPVLLFSRLPATATEASVRSACFSNGFDPQAIKFLPSETNKMALVKLADQTEAIACLVAMHNYSFPEGGYLRVSFSRHAELTA